MRSLVLVSLAIPLFWSCEFSGDTRTETCQEKDEMIVSLKEQLNKNQSYINQGTSVISQIQLILDTIAMKQNEIQLNRSEGDNVLDRIKDIQEYINDRENQIAQLEADLAEMRSRSASSRTADFTTIIANLKADIRSQKDTVAVWKVRYAASEEKNQVLQETLVVTTNELDSTKEVIEEFAEEIQALEVEKANMEKAIAEQQDLTQQAKAEKFFQIGKTLEEIGDKYKLKRKKNDSYAQALTNYQKAEKLGHEDALVCINRVNYKMN